MVVFVDYDQGSYDDAHHHRPGDAGAVLHSRVLRDKSPFLSSITLSSAHPDRFPPQGTQAGARQGDDVDATASSSEKRDRLNDNAFSAALSCYPYGPLIPSMQSRFHSVDANRDSQCRQGDC